MCASCRRLAEKDRIKARKLSRERLASLWQRTGLSGKLLLLTICFVMLSEILILFPSLGNYWENRLRDHLEASKIAVLALEASPDHTVTQDLSRMLLSNAGVSSVSLKRADRRALALGMEHPESIRGSIDLRTPANFSAMIHALRLLVLGGEGSIRVIGNSNMGEDERIEIVIAQPPLRAALFEFSERILLLSTVISVVTATLVFFAIDRLMVRPTRRLTSNMIAFREDPDNAERVIKPSPRRDEIGTMEQELAHMQTKIRADLQRRKKLAALGLAVSKINHDLRNMLSSAQLISDRIAELKDPETSRLAPRLVASIGRAIALCKQTLRFGREEERKPRLDKLDLHALVEEVGRSVGIVETSGIVWRNNVDEGFRLYADSEQFFRILMNLGRNAVQAMESCHRTGDICVSAKRLDQHVEIEVRDNARGVPDEVREWLKKDFAAPLSGRIGLGLAITRELIRLHGGEMSLASTSEAGSSFRIALPHG